MNNKSVLLEAQALERSYFTKLEQLWETIPASQRSKIEETASSLRSKGAICSEYDFIEASL